MYEIHFRKILTMALPIMLVSISGFAYGVGPHNGSYAHPWESSGLFVVFSANDSPGPSNYPFGGFQINSSVCRPIVGSLCSSNCPVGTPIAASKIPNPSPMAGSIVQSVSFNTFSGVADTTSTYCLVQDGNKAYWAIKRRPATVITSANEALHIQPCQSTDMFDPATGCTAAPAVAQNIPLFSPIGLIAMLLGLMYFGIRQVHRI